jgi:hypothetical protein
LARVLIGIVVVVVLIVIVVVIVVAFPSLLAPTSRSGLWKDGNC